MYLRIIDAVSNLAGFYHPDKNIRKKASYHDQKVQEPSSTGCLDDHKYPPRTDVKD